MAPPWLGMANTPHKNRISHPGPFTKASEPLGEAALEVVPCQKRAP